MCNKNDVVRHALFKLEKHNKELRTEICELEEHIKHLQLIIKVQRCKLNEILSGRKL